MRLEDIFWPWGVIKDLEQDVAILDDQVKRGRLALMEKITSSLTNIEYGARQRDIAANLRSECLRLHEELARLNDVLGYVSTMAENNQTTKRLEVLYDIQTRTGVEIVSHK